MQSNIAAIGPFIAILMYAVLKSAVGSLYKWRDARRNRVIKVKPLK